MICKRCGSGCPNKPGGYCFHCLVGLGLGLVNKETNLPIEGVKEGFPDWEKPTKKDRENTSQGRLL